MQQRLEQAYELLQVQGQAVTIPQLCRMAQTSIPAANAFLDAKLGDVQARLGVSYERLQAQGITVIGKERLAKAAQTSKARAEKFLRARAVHRQV